MGFMRRNRDDAVIRAPDDGAVRGEGGGRSSALDRGRQQRSGDNRSGHIECAGLQIVEGGSEPSADL
jgi:hypothetical protein